MWYYSYESGSTKTQREMKHVYAASNCSERKFTPYWWTLIQPRHTKGPGLGQQRMTGTDGRTIELEEKEVPLGYRSPSPVQWAKQEGLGPVTSGIDEDAVEDEAKHVAPTQSQERSEAEPPVDQPTHFCCLCQERLTFETHSLQLQALDFVKQLLLLRLLVFGTPLEAFSFYFSEMDSRIRSEWLFNIPPTRQGQLGVDDPADRTAVAEMKSSLTLADFVGDEKTVKSSTSKLERVFLQSCADLLLAA
ncbi:hypothetical protein PR003_g13861 [Phytophthora rubi]|uniref:Uncharacterized protein n=2 Tax=Phytophthora rubi TaxID=129364 RepID=A0A6A4EWG1_9STRA|nr:hypothetical protein PR001_g12902 [Phytophthora rubi]KAE9333764.1 hypothetical protein PR003_g13861 [Phytophthora rubi]